MLLLNTVLRWAYLCISSVRSKRVMWIHNNYLPADCSIINTMLFPVIPARLTNKVAQYDLSYAES